ncbi:drug/metabolite transporter (DMT)-like permease [Lysinibacter cavernae]|uniref:Drug/metabolite transporter (DMT)-like permease n=1 Tax=Lysinibacter cavernae TaxID=1640652 RepID=A0A7X5QZN1_9MICO|nr:drug/metabolite transporter (DMT)-like permease [Lysinibacter cavernae]
MSAFILALGNLGQSRGIKRATEKPSSTTPLLGLIHTRSWLGGTALIGLAMLLQMGSLALAPLILVQPLGVAALVFTVILTTRASGKRIAPDVRNAIFIVLGGVALYVIVAASVSKQKAIGNQQLVWILGILAAVLILSLVVFLIGKTKKLPPFTFVILGGIYSGFIATLGKTVILRVEAMFKGGVGGADSGSWLTLLCIVAISIASALSIVYVQYSHTCNSPDIVIAGLTIVDPSVAVLLGITILHEAAGAPAWSIVVLLIAGIIAFSGVLKLATAEAKVDS